MAPPLLSGHGVQAADQVVLASLTLAQLHEHVGGTVVVELGGRANGTPAGRGYGDLAGAGRRRGV